MKTCKTCGTTVQDDFTMFCPRCGAKLDATTGGYQPASNYQSAPYSQQPTSPYQPYSQQPTSPYQPSALYPMKWYKFLIYFALFFGALMNVVYGIQYLNGDIYENINDGVSKEWVYAVMGSDLKTLDVIMGILMIGLGVFGVYVRFALAKFKANAPMCVYILYGANAVISLIYTIAVVSITEIELDYGREIVSIILMLVMVGLNYTYFKKRQSLFNQ